VLVTAPSLALNAGGVGANPPFTVTVGGVGVGELVEGLAVYVTNIGMFTLSTERPLDVVTSQTAVPVPLTKGTAQTSYVPPDVGVAVVVAGTAKKPPVSLEVNITEVAGGVAPLA
jgi:hypothetical protein